MAKKIGNMSSLQFALSQLSTDKQMDDEFTIDEFIKTLSKNGENITVSSATSRINVLISKGLLVKRKARINGRLLNLYRKND